MSHPNIPEIIVSEHLKLRPFRKGDEESLVKYANHREIWENLMDMFPHPYTRKDAEKWIDFCKTDKRGIHLAIIYRNELIGAVGANFKDDIYRYNAEIGFWIGKPFWGKSIMSKVIPVFCNEVFRVRKVNRLYGMVFPENRGSGRVLEKSGFLKECTLRKAAFKDGFFKDLDVYALLKEDYRN